ncbi:filamentous hemagglutinin N-terminal domain-containing protein [Alkalinema pantanalense CENA528]|uniref:two-partner secretion domain-containing protein n=1 Tax=Alkalinema pantanalense TaxID=1620705 RepID=UPI003D6E0475
MQTRSIVGVFGLFVGLLSGVESAIAQVIPDGTLPTTVTSPDALNFTIDGGGRSGGNIFHSFSQLSVPTGGSAFFNNALDVQNIFARVTGGTASNIDGLIKANGAASLFLLNPSGILFGPNASLNLGGSFLGTTASSIQFADSTEFSAVNAGTPLLTMSAPIGLQMGVSSGSIRVQGQGHNLSHPPLLAGAVMRNPQQPGLRVLPGKTLALIGNGINLDSGVLIAESGKIELGSVNTGMVAVNTTSALGSFSYDRATQFSDIRLTQASLLDASGSPGGFIHLQGQTTQIHNSSVILVQHYGSQLAGQIQVHTDVLELSGALPNRDRSLILTENLGSSPGANVEVSARRMMARDGGVILSTTYNNGGAGGDITVNATESIDFLGFSSFEASRTSGLSSPSYRGGGRGGNIAVNTQDLLLQDGAGINSLIFGGLRGGNITIAAENIAVMGENPGIAGASNIAVSTFFGGNAGSISIDTGRLLLKSSGLISASTSGASDAGSLSINARDSIEIDGSGSVVAQRSRITASGQQLPPRFRQIFGLPALPTGDGGNLSINASSIKVHNQGYIAAENVGSGNAGYLKINANEVVLDLGGQIRTSTAVGQGGVLELNVRDLLLLRRNSLISAKANGLGNGGNIEIDAPVLVGLDNSDIIASAFKGRGGNINITTQGILGLQYRDRLTPENDITASSEFGINGNVQVNTIGTDPNAGLTELPINVTDPSQKIATGCTPDQGSQFVATGRGGIPQNPNQQVTEDRTWNDLRDLSVYRGSQGTVAQVSVNQPILVQASGFQRNADGTIDLIASPVPVNPPTIATCSGQNVKMVRTL